MKKNVMSYCNNEKLLQYVLLQKLTENDYVLPKILKFKKISMGRSCDSSLESIIWYNKFTLPKSFYKELVLFAIRNNKIDIVKWLTVNVKIVLNFGLAHAASYYGYLEIVKYLHTIIPNKKKNKKKNFSNLTMCMASMKGHLHIIKWHHANIKNCCSEMAINYAVENGHLHIVKWFYENKIDVIPNDIMDYAAEQGQLEIIKFVHENMKELNKGCTTDAMDFAAQNGHFEVVKFLHENRMEGCTKQAMEKAARNGHFDIIKYLHKNRSHLSETEYCSESVIAAAIIDNYLDIAKWLYENIQSMKGKWHLYRTISFAIHFNGRLECIKWIFENIEEINDTYKKFALSKVNSPNNIHIKNYLINLRKRKREIDE